MQFISHLSKVHQVLAIRWRRFWISLKNVFKSKTGDAAFKCIMSSHLMNLLILEWNPRNRHYRRETWTQLDRTCWPAGSVLVEGKLKLSLIVAVACCNFEARQSPTKERFFHLTYLCTILPQPRLKDLRSWLWHMIFMPSREWHNSVRAFTFPRNYLYWFQRTV